MSDIAVHVENLGKQYRLGQLRSMKALRSQTLSESLSHTMSRVMRRSSKGALPNPNPKARQIATDDELMWALKDISFDVKKGEALGIIGHNGAGKSTLLKILSRITEPTEGFVDIRGRIAALLEVGTGFHLELTGRENVLLNGAILGMTRQEILRKFDEIVDFAGVERFIDTPVKRYSSGMRLRLGFAVAAHLEPDILVIDEVLAVGDAEFQQKCLGKMQEVAQEGRTVLFVSHNLDAVTTLTERSILLKSGCIVDSGDSETVVRNYLRSLDNQAEMEGWMDLTPFADPNHHDIEFTSMSLVGEDGERRSVFSERESIVLALGLRIHRPNGILRLGVSIDDATTSRALFTVPTEVDTTELPHGDYELKLALDPLRLRNGYFGSSIKYRVNGMKHPMIKGLNFKITTTPFSDSLDQLYQQKWVTGPFRFDYKFGAPEPEQQKIPSVEQE